jgi:serine/threonine-protein kinase HipA
MVNAAFIKIWDELVGAVSWDETRAMASFEFDSKFQSHNWDLSPLKMPVNSPSRVFTFPELRRLKNTEFDTFKSLPGLLADVLPDKYGNQLINAWLARQGRPTNSMNPVEMLCFIGTRGMGALEFEPILIKEHQRTFSVDMESLVLLAQKVLDQKKLFATRIREENEQAINDILKIGTSAGGARPKAVIAYNEKTGEVRSGQTNAPNGFEHWLIKLDGVSDIQLGASKGYGRVEMAYYLMATSCGIDMMPSRLMEENGRAHFMTKRFDREPGNVKHHIQTFCALKHFDYNEVTSFSYEQLFQTMRELKLSYPEAEQMYRRMVFNVLARNCDDHTKNFSFKLTKNGNWSLAPAYDICHAYKPGHQWVSQHALSINGRRREITTDDFLSIARSMNIRKADQIVQQIGKQVNNWNKFADEAGVAKKIRKEIADTLIHLK